MATVSTVVAVAGMSLAGVLYFRAREAQREPLESVKPIHTLLSQKYYLDSLYEDVVVRRVFYGRFAGMVDWLDRNMVDGLVDAVAWIIRNIGPVLGRLQTGQVQSYGAVIAFGILIILLGFLLA